MRCLQSDSLGPCAAERASPTLSSTGCPGRAGRLGRVRGRLLLDTHILLWWLDGDRRLSRRGRAAIADENNVVFVSAASAWELATKARLGKLPGAIDVATDVAGCLTARGSSTCPSCSPCAAGGKSPYRSPGSVRSMLIAQGQMEDFRLSRARRCSTGLASRASGDPRLTQVVGPLVVSV